MRFSDEVPHRAVGEPDGSTTDGGAAGGRAVGVDAVGGVVADAVGGVVADAVGGGVADAAADRLRRGGKWRWFRWALYPALVLVVGSGAAWGRAALVNEEPSDLVPAWILLSIGCVAVIALAARRGRKRRPRSALRIATAVVAVAGTLAGLVALTRVIDPCLKRGVGLDLTACTFAGKDLHGAVLEGADLTGVDLSQANLEGANLRGAVLAGATLVQARLAGANLAEAVLTEADMSSATVGSANLAGADLSEVNASGATFDGASLQRATMPHANFAGARLAKADLSRTGAIAASFPGATLTEVDLESAVFTEVDFTGATVADSKLAGTNLRRATMSGAVLRNLDLTGTVLTDTVNLENAALASALGVEPGQVSRAVVDRGIVFDTPAEIAKRVEPACAGSPVEGTPGYEDSPAFHALVVAGPGGDDSDLAATVRDNHWAPAGVRFAELVACVDSQTTTSLEVCPYTTRGSVAPSITRRQLHRRVRLVAPATGETVSERTFSGAAPMACPFTASYSQTEIRGSAPSSDEGTGWRTSSTPIGRPDRARAPTAVPQARSRVQEMRTGGGRRTKPAIDVPGRARYLSRNPESNSSPGVIELPTTTAGWLHQFLSFLRGCSFRTSAREESRWDSS